MANHPPAPENTTMPTNSENNPFTRYTRFWHRLSVYQQRGVLALIALVFIVMVFGYKSTPEMTGGARLIRDAIIFCATATGILLAVWRLELAEKRFLNEQFANAVELMAKDIAGNPPKPAIAARIGGIYIMADLATKLPAEFAERVVKNLIAYIKDNAQKTAAPELEKGETPAKPRTLGSDVRAAFSVLHDILGDNEIRKFISTKGRQYLDFSYQDFSWLDFEDIQLHHYKKWVSADFRGCNLTYACFAEGADMVRAKFSNAILSDSKFNEVNLAESDFRGANLEHISMRGANLLAAKMQGCFMRHANLQKADNGGATNLMGAHLIGAYMASANLSGAYVEHADMRGVVLSAHANLTLIDDLMSAIFGTTYMASADFGDDDTKAMLSREAECKGVKIWLDHSDVVKQDSERPNINWNLKQYEEDGYALAGVLRNFAEAPYPEHFGIYPDGWLRNWRAHKEINNIRQQATKLEKLPDKMPEEIKAWLEKIKAE